VDNQKPDFRLSLEQELSEKYLNKNWTVVQIFQPTLRDRFLLVLLENISNNHREMIDIDREWKNFNSWNKLKVGEKIRIKIEKSEFKEEKPLGPRSLYPE
ncbi:MAG: hypothetical protein V1692_01630, partial [bacterium]